MRKTWPAVILLLAASTSGADPEAPAMAPDLVVGSIEISPVSAGAFAEVRAEVRNVGSGAALEPFLAAMRVDGRIEVEMLEGWYRLAPGESEAITFRGWRATAGSHEIEIVLDPLDVVQESDEGNNAARTRFVGARPEGAEGPRLVLNWVEVDLDGSAAGGNVSVLGLVQNVGDAPAPGPVRLAIETPRGPFQEASVPIPGELASGEARRFRLSARLPEDVARGETVLTVRPVQPAGGPGWPDEWLAHAFPAGHPSGAPEPSWGDKSWSVAHAGIAWTGEVAYVFGGSDREDMPTTRVWRFDPASGRVAPLAATLPHAVVGATAAWDPHARVAYVFGGAPAGAGRVLRFDPAADRIEPTEAILPEGFCCGTAVWDGASVLLFGAAHDCRVATCGAILRYDPVGDEVVEFASVLPQPLRWTTGAWTGEEALLVGGWVASTGEPSDAIYRFDPATGVLREAAARLPGPDNTTAGIAEATAAWTGRELYVLGGFPTGARSQAGEVIPRGRLLVRYDPQLDVAERVDLDWRLDAWWGAGALWDGANLTAFGGRFTDDEGQRAARPFHFWAFDPVAGNLSRFTGPQPEGGDGPREIARVRVGHDRDAPYVSWGGGPSLDAIDLYHLEQDEIRILDAIVPAPSGGAEGAGVWDDRALPELGCPTGCVYYFRDASDGGAGSGLVYRFDPSNRSVAPTKSSVPAGLSDFPAVRVGDSVYLLGGWLGAQGAPTSEILRYDPQHDVLTSDRARLPLALSHSAAATDGERVYVFGGISDRSDTRTDAIVLFDPATGETKLVSAKLSAPCSDASALWTGDRFFLFGGKCGYDRQANYVQIYDPVNDTLVLLKGSLPDARSGIAALLHEGTVYLLGGADGPYGTSSEVVRFDPISRAYARAERQLPGPGVADATAIGTGNTSFLVGGRTNTGAYDAYGSVAARAILELNAIHEWNFTPVQAAPPNPPPGLVYNPGPDWRAEEVPAGALPWTLAAVVGLALVARRRPGGDA